MINYRADLIHALINIFCIFYALVILRGTTRDIGSDKEVKYYKTVVWCFIGFAASNIYWLFNMRYPGEFLMLLVNAVNISFMLGIAASWVIYAETKLAGRDKEIPVLTRILVLIPFAVLTVLTWLSIKTRMMFYVENNDLVQGKFYIAIIITIAAMFLVVAVHAAIEASRTSSKSRKRECTTLVLFAVMPLLAGVLDSFLPNLPLMTPSVFFSLLLIFAQQQESNISNDALTGMYNRRCAQDYIDDAVRDADDKPFCFILLDAKKFGKINDIYGHLTGDRVLRIMGKALDDFAKENDCLSARWGGDEFVVVIDKKKCDNPEEIIKHINRLVWEGVRVSGVHVETTFDGGYCYCESSKTNTDDVLKSAEEMLEKVKSAT